MVTRVFLCALLLRRYDRSTAFFAEFVIFPELQAAFNAMCHTASIIPAAL